MYKTVWKNNKFSPGEYVYFLGGIAHTLPKHGKIVGMLPLKGSDLDYVVEWKEYNGTHTRRKKVSKRYIGKKSGADDFFKHGEKVLKENGLFLRTLSDATIDGIFPDGTYIIKENGLLIKEVITQRDFLIKKVTPDEALELGEIYISNMNQVDEKIGTLLGFDHRGFAVIS